MKEHLFIDKYKKMLEENKMKNIINGDGKW